MITRKKGQHKVIRSIDRKSDQGWKDDRQTSHPFAPPSFSLFFFLSSFCWTWIAIFRECHSTNEHARQVKSSINSSTEQRTGQEIVNFRPTYFGRALPNSKPWPNGNSHETRGRFKRHSGRTKSNQRRRILSWSFDSRTALFRLRRFSRRVRCCPLPNIFILLFDPKQIFSSFSSLTKLNQTSIKSAAAWCRHLKKSVCTFKINLKFDDNFNSNTLANARSKVTSLSCFFSSHTLSNSLGCHSFITFLNPFGRHLHFLINFFFSFRFSLCRRLVRHRILCPFLQFLVRQSTSQVQRPIWFTVSI